ncbi:MAG: hypothetical protein ACR2FU_00630 [Streptosporangiaceae bacterium]
MALEVATLRRRDHCLRSDRRDAHRSSGPGWPVQAAVAWLAEVEVRPMEPQPPGSVLFGAPYLLTALFRASAHTREDRGER